MMVRVGIAGVGFMGWIHYLAYARAEGIELAAIQSRSDKKRRGDWSDIQGNFGPTPGQVDLSGIAAYDGYDEMLADDSLDVIDICLPPNMHVEAAVQALQAGKHVFCEKPLALNPQDCDRLMEVATAEGKQLLVGQVLPFFPEYSAARQIIDSGEYGALLGGSFKRIISDPSQGWLQNFFEMDEIGGPMVDLHVHDAHLILLLFGMPKAVTSAGRLRGDVVEYCETLFHYDTNQVVHATCGVINQQGRPFTHGFEIHLQSGTLNYEFAGYADQAEHMPLKL